MDDVEFLQMTLPQASTAMIAGQIDGALLAGSLVINAQKNGAHIVATADGLVTPKLVIAAKGDLIESHREALDWIEKNLEEALRDDIEFMLKNRMLSESLQPESCIAATAMP